jgi:hypothetical protein
VKEVDADTHPFVFAIRRVAGNHLAETDSLTEAVQRLVAIVVCAFERRVKLVFPACDDAASTAEACTREGIVLLREGQGLVAIVDGAAAGRGAGPGTGACLATRSTRTAARTGQSACGQVRRVDTVGRGGERDQLVARTT